MKQNTNYKYNTKIIEMMILMLISEGSSLIKPAFAGFKVSEFPPYGVNSSTLKKENSPFL